MTIIVFLLDTSASMNQKVFLGGRPSLLDVAKSAVETFVKVRQRSPESRQDRYMLLTFEEPPLNIKAGWKENLNTFMTELKNLQANGLTTLGGALRHTFDVLNVNRMQHGIDTYGQGRSPFYLEPSVIIAITDGGKLSSNSGVQEELKIHGSSPGCELTREPFRWDQRLFSLVLRMSGQPLNERETGLVPSDHSPIDAMCEVTGGRSYCITSHRMMLQCIDSLVQKVQAGVVLHFEKVGPDPIPVCFADKSEMDDLDGANMKVSWHNSHKMIYVPRTNQKGYAGGFWPIPESFFPDPNMPTLPPRTSHPHVKFTCVAQEPMVVENFPFDKYELEPSLLTQFILARKQPSVCWQCYVSSSSKSGQIQPFGYLKASGNLTSVNLFVMPHNYPVLLPLLDELFRVYRLKPTNEWRNQFGLYLATMPGYYAGPLKRALMKMNATVLATNIQEETYLSYSVLTYLKKLKTTAKMEYERTCNEVGIRAKANELRKPVMTNYKNPYDVPRHQLLEHLSKLKAHFLRPSSSSDLNQDNVHSVPISQMGLYQEYIKRQPTPLREIEAAPVRQHMFGNPFKVDKRLMIDEADIDLIQGTKQSKKQALTEASQNQIVTTTGQSYQQRGLKRKRGPIPIDYQYIPRKARKVLTPDGTEVDVYSSDNESSYTSAASSAASSPASTPEHSPAASEDEYDEYWIDEDFQEPEKDENEEEEELPDVGNENDFSITQLQNNKELKPAAAAPPEPVKSEPPIPVPPLVTTAEKDELPLGKLNGTNGDPQPQPLSPTLPVTPIPVPTIKVEPDLVPTVESTPVAKVNGTDTITLSSSTSDIAAPNSKTSVVTDIWKKAFVQKKNSEKKSSENKSPLPSPKPKAEQDGFVSSTLSAKVKSESKPSSPKRRQSIKSDEVVDGVIKKSSKKLKKDKVKSKKTKSSKEPKLSDEAVRQLNLDLKKELCKEIQRPRFRMDFFLTELTKIAGSVETKTNFLRMLELEAKRYKRKRVADLISQQITGVA